MDYLANDTIVAPATATGGALAILRVSGPDSLRIAQALAPQKKWDDRLAVHSLFRNRQGEVLDDGVGIFFKNPQSYTGEDTFEIYAHGGTATVEALLQEIIDLGARTALPGEFSFRAVKNGKLSLSQAEAVADLIAAKNRGASALALEKLQGLMNRQVGALSEEIRTLVTLSELGIDFSDQDVEEVSLKNLKKRAETLQKQLTDLKNTFSRGGKIQNGVRTVFVGLPNVGKSSFFNALLGEERSIVSDIAGTTRDVIRETLKLRAGSTEVTLRMEDTAGLRDGQDPIEKIGVERTKAAVAQSDLMVVIVNGAKPEPETLVPWFKNLKTQALSIGILTHGDLKWDEKALKKNLETHTGISNWKTVSSFTGDGVSDAADFIAKQCATWTHRTPGELILTRVEHERAVCRAIEDISRALESQDEELFAADLRQALSHLAPLIGQTATDDILGRIFSQFCIGK